ncbi:MAG: GDP-mannose 4,6-dehydratase [Polynucleobacter sp.]|uniref:GDP-mannose 4,6-dehydratase n=1 Tax=Polynucleobacter sp. TaxID=2029855 RepID=UPI002727F71E|nr:GDP-mannose 4,6-dehydratase [Polynucleobacter sp.]MDO8713796.1 GDP-mannose 4,6-dehydratase [Polynucleobacter sp.]
MANSKRALILGVTGQDGAHIASQLIAKGWEVYGGFRRGSSANIWRLEHLGLIGKVKLVNINIDEPFNLIDAFRQIQPDHIYHFAGESFVADSFIHPTSTFESNSICTLYVLEAMRHAVPAARLFFASSSEVFGPAQVSELLDEESKLLPSNPYGISKLSAQHMVRMYRETYGMFAAVGILFNHEGILRARNFVTRKITSNLARLKLQGGDPIELGDFSSSRDWGAADDYTEAMIRVLHLDEPEDFVFATGKLTSVRQFLTKAASAAGYSPGFEGEGKSEICFDSSSGVILARVSEQYFRPFDTAGRRGNNEKLTARINWEGSKSIDTIACEMVYADIERWKAGVRNI